MTNKVADPIAERPTAQPMAAKALNPKPYAQTLNRFVSILQWAWVED